MTQRECVGQYILSAFYLVFVLVSWVIATADWLVLWFVTCAMCCCFSPSIMFVFLTVLSFPVVHIPSSDVYGIFLKFIFIVVPSKPRLNFKLFPARLTLYPVIGRACPFTHVTYDNMTA